MSLEFGDPVKITLEDGGVSPWRKSLTLFESVEAFNNIGDKTVAAIPGNTEDFEDVTSVAWQIRRDEATDTYMITSQRTGGVLYESKEYFNYTGDKKCVATSPMDKNKQQPGKWRWRIERDEVEGQYTITNAATGGVLFQSERAFNGIATSSVYQNEHSNGVATSSVDKDTERAGKWRWRIRFVM